MVDAGLKDELGNPLETHVIPPRQTRAQLARQRRAAEALRLKIIGATIAQIADRLKVSRPTVSKDLRFALSQVAQERRQLAGQELDLQLQRLEDLVRRAYAIASHGVPKRVRIAVEGMRSALNQARGMNATEKAKGWKNIRVLEEFAEQYGDPTVMLMAIDKIVKIVERTSKLLGLDAPDRLHIEFSDVDALVLEVGQLALRYIPEEHHRAFREDVQRAVVEQFGAGLDDQVAREAEIVEQGMEAGRLPAAKYVADGLDETGDAAEIPNVSAAPDPAESVRPPKMDDEKDGGGGNGEAEAST